ncbi:MFS general substrate transporter [Aureobasidium namibiae CBS 147.97]|uniref:MFS general substrate transporter n=1 Tax=Aureobasidium namibiae CBS 147.97 TaxID=1043004 RepID=A0A074WAL8_9PEZI|nr:MFS general substrate transporter [Aureobasidium namibiae CBS 147.97]KEQ70110.1 MFS general substrate transporter [Aureobasidium namibiae CBS 147.97]
MSTTDGVLHQQPTSTTTESSNIPTFRLISLILGLCIGLFLSLLDTSIVATALYSIGTSFSAPHTSTWVALSYTLSYLGFATLMQLVGLRAVQGVGGSGLYSLTMIVLPEIVSEGKRKWIGAVVGAVVAVAGVMGPVVGGVMTKFASWRWVFWINGPVGVVAVVLFLLTWPKQSMMKQPVRRSWRQLDLLGFFLLIAASVLVVFAFQRAGLRANSWDTALFLAPLLVGCLCCLPLHFQIVNGSSPLMAGVALLPLLMSAAVGSMLGGLSTNHSFPALAIANSLMAVGTGLLTTLSSHHGIQVRTYAFKVPLGLGMGLSISTSTLLAALRCEGRDMAIAQGIVAQARVLGGSIGIAASSAVVGGITVKGGREGQVGDERMVYAKAFSKTMWVCAVVACIALIISTSQAFAEVENDAPMREEIVMEKAV